MENDQEFFIPLEKIKPFIKSIDSSFRYNINNNIVGLKENLLRKIVESALGKVQFSDADARRFSFIHFEHIKDREFIGLDNNVIGEISMFQKQKNFQWKIGFEFQPGEMVMQNGSVQFIPKSNIV